jgi:hypothetical protein
MLHRKDINELTEHFLLNQVIDPVFPPFLLMIYTCLHDNLLQLIPHLFNLLTLKQVVKIAILCLHPKLIINLIFFLIENYHSLFKAFFCHQKLNPFGI